MTCVLCGLPVPEGRRKLCSPECARERKRKQCAKRYHSRPQEYKETTRMWQNANPVRYLLTQAKATAKKRGWEFALTEADIEIPRFCPILGLELAKVKSREDKDFRPSLDRIDSSKGYVPGNVQVISWRANRLKGSAALEELVKLGQWAKGVLPKILAVSPPPEIGPLYL